MQLRNSFATLTLVVSLTASLGAWPTSLFAASRSTTAKGTATLVYMSDFGPVPFLYPAEVTTKATYTTKYDSRTRQTITSVSRTDQSLLLKGAKNSPCEIALSVATTVYRDNRYTYLTFKEYSKDSAKGSYLVNSTSVIKGFVNTTAFSLVAPRLETTGFVASYDCLGQRSLTNRLDLP